MNIVRFVMGDYSDDGHGKKDEFYFYSNVDLETIKKAYQKAVDIIGIDIIEDCCEEYEDSSISKDNINTLEEHLGKLNLDLKEDFEEDDCIALTENDWIKIIKEYIKLGDPDIQLIEIKCDDFFDIGGYGIYY